MFSEKNKSDFSRGVSLVEVLIGASIITIALVVIVNIYASLVSISIRNTPRIQATLLAEEGIEAVKIMRDGDWTSNIGTLSNSTNYHLYWNGTSWISTTTSFLIDDVFDRNFTISDVYRDSNFNITNTGGGTFDAGSKKVTVTVSWANSNGTSTTFLSGYVFNTFNN